MATQLTDPALRFSFASGAPAGSGSFDVVNLKGFEGISKSFRFDLILMSRKADVDFDAMLANPAELHIFASNSTESTPYFGELSAFEQLQQVGNIVFYQATLVPRLERLGRGRTSDVYLGDQTIPQVLDGVLKAGGLVSKDFAINTHRSYRNRDLVCQFQESFLDFFSRWTEKEGMHYFFEHDATAGFEKLQVIDSKSQIPATAVAVKYLQVDSVAGTNQTNLVQGFVRRQKQLPKQVVLQGFNYGKADVRLEVTSPISATGHGDVMLYGENFLDEKEGDSYAEIRAQEIVCRAVVFAGESTATGLRSGYFLDLSGHYRADVDGKYLVTEIHHTGSQAGLLLAGIRSPYSDSSGETWYCNTFTALQEAVQFRPERTTPRPRIGGTMTATVDSEGGGVLAELDEKGRYKIRMPFMKSGKNPMKASALVRMATPYLGSDHGMSFPLHKGAEVVLSFTDGDPDQPLILSAVPNTENPSLVNKNNPAESFIRTKGGNQILMNDTRGSERIELSSPHGNTQFIVGYMEPSKDEKGKEGEKEGEKEGGSEEAPTSIWIGTNGSAQSITAGVFNEVKAGYTNALNLTVENSLSVGIENSVKFAGETSLGLGFEAVWKHGKAIKISEAESLEFTSEAKHLATDKIVMGGGQSPAVTTAVQAATRTAKIALALNAAVCAAMGVASVALLSSSKKTKGGEIENKNLHSAARVLAAGAGLPSVMAQVVLMRTMLKAVEQVEQEISYLGKIVLDNAGVDITANGVAAAVPVPGVGAVKVATDSVKVSAMLSSALPGSDLEVTPLGVDLTARLGDLQTTFKLAGLSAELKTGLGGTIELKNSVAVLGASVALNDDEIRADLGTSLLSLTRTDGAVLRASFSNCVQVTRAYTLVQAGATKVKLSPAGAVIDAGPRLDINAATTRLNGAIIQLG